MPLVPPLLPFLFGEDEDLSSLVVDGGLTHSAADIIRQLMIDLTLGTAPSDGSSWPIYVDQEPSRPDNCLTVFGTSSVHQGRLMINGEVQERYGFQIRIRSANYLEASAKSRAIAITFDQGVRWMSVAVDTSVYLIHGISRSSGPINLGKNVPETKRNIFTFNATVSLIQTT